MKKITIFDCNKGKFSRVLKDHWEKQGHEVKFTLYWDPALCDDADVIFFDWADNSVHRASDPTDGLYRDIHKFPKDANVIVRAHDIDVWTGGLRGIHPGLVNTVVFVADHVRKQAEISGQIPKDVEVKTIKHGIDSIHFDYREHWSKDIAWIGRYDENKNPLLALMVLMELPRDWTLHLLGIRKQAPWQEAYWHNLIKRNNLKVQFTESVEDVNVWLDDKAYLLNTSGKEAFCYAVGESMSKGIKPVVHHFYGAEEVWPSRYLWNSVNEAVEQIEGDHSPVEYRQYIETYYPLGVMLEAYDKLL